MQNKSPETRLKIIENSARLFSKFGLYKTTIDEISSSLHMGKSSLYYYFKNKEDIFKAVIETEVEEMRGKIRTAIQQAATPQEKLRLFGIMRMKLFKELTNMYSALRDNYLNNYAFIQDIRQSHDRIENEFVENILREGVALGVFSIDDVPLTARTIITALKGLEFEWALSGTEIDIEANITKMSNILFYGIAKK